LLTDVICLRRREVFLLFGCDREALYRVENEYE